MGVRTRGLDIATSAKRQVADAAARAEAKAVVERWNGQLVMLGLRCSWCPGSAPMPKLLGLHALPPQAVATAQP
jgi:hypothetical protein